MIKNIRYSISKSAFHKELQKTKVDRKFVNLAKANKIGIIADVSNPLDCEHLSKFIKRIADQSKKNVTALGYFQGKLKPEHPAHKLGIPLFFKKEVSWLYMPKSEQVKAFYAQDFDLLFVINPLQLTVLNYIAGLSRAFCRVGFYAESAKPYLDLMVQNKDAKTSLQESLVNIEKTVLNINK